MLIDHEAQRKMKELGYRPIAELDREGLDVMFLLWNGREVWGCLCVGIVSPASRTYWSRDADLRGRPPIGFRYASDFGSYRREVA